jgi:hypothetical protein
LRKEGFFKKKKLQVSQNNLFKKKDNVGDVMTFKD